MNKHDIMRTELASLDLFFLVPEINSALAGGIIQKAWQNGKEVWIEIFVPNRGTSIIYFAPGRIFLTAFRRSAPETPGNFAMVLRKHLSGQKIDEVAQHGFDRVVELKTGDYSLVFELFSKGNVILCNKDYNIISAVEIRAWKDRLIKPREHYKFPQSSAVTPLKIELSSLHDMLKREKNEAVKFLASDLCLSGLYAEELLARSGIEKTKQTDQLSEAEISELLRQLAGMFSSKQPQIIIENNSPVNVVPFPLKLYEGRESKNFQDFNAAADEFFSGAAAPKDEKTAALEAERGKLLHRLEEQRAAAEKWSAVAQESRERAKRMERNIETVERILSAVGKARNSGIEWQEIKARAAEEEPAIVEIREKDGKIVLEL